MDVRFTGAAVVSRGCIYPELIGGDIGCGMSLIKLDIARDKATVKRVQRWMRQLQDLDMPWRGNVRPFAEQEGMVWPTAHTIGPIESEAFDQGE
jgi:release factor H-coupled RctB family protein